MLEPFAVPLFSLLWWGGVLGTIAVMAFVLSVGSRCDAIGRARLGRVLGLIILLVTQVLTPLYLYKAGWFHLAHSLPLHLCSLSAIAAGVLMFFPAQILFEFVFYWGTIGGAISLLTPLMDQGWSNYLVVDYYVMHSGIMIIGVYASKVLGMKPRQYSWAFAVLGVLFFMAPLVLGINELIGANYMFISHRPIDVDNPLNFGEWPWYIFMWAGMFMLIFWSLYRALHVRQNSDTLVRQEIPSEHHQSKKG